jgi:hypothetical protein
MKGIISRVCLGCKEEKFMKISSLLCGPCAERCNPIGMVVSKRGKGGGGQRGHKLPSQRITGMSSPLLGRRVKP